MNAENELIRLIHYIHSECVDLVVESVGKYLPVAGNIGVFCQNEEDYERLSAAGRKLTQASTNPNQKYFRLNEPVTIADSDIPAVTYEYLYVRKPATDSPEAGDVDFILDSPHYEELKKRVAKSEIPNAAVYERPGWDMVELKSDGKKGLAYICTQTMAEKVRVRF